MGNLGSTQIKDFIPSSPHFLKLSTILCVFIVLQRYFVCQDLYTGPESPAAFDWVLGKYSDWKVAEPVYRLMTDTLDDG